MKDSNISEDTKYSEFSYKKDLRNLEDAKYSNFSYRKIQGIVGDHSLSVILPKSYAINLGIGKGDFVKVHQEAGKIVIEKA